MVGLVAAASLLLLLRPLARALFLMPTIRRAKSSVELGVDVHTWPAACVIALRMLPATLLLIETSLSRPGERPLVAAERHVVLVTRPPFLVEFRIMCPLCICCPVFTSKPPTQPSVSTFTRVLLVDQKRRSRPRPALFPAHPKRRIAERRRQCREHSLLFVYASSGPDADVI